MDSSEFIELVKENRKIIYKICHSFCSDPQDRKDLEQEILLQLWKSMPQFKGRSKISTWIYKVALNTSMIYNREISRYRVKNTTIESIPGIISLAAEARDWEKEEQLKILYSFINKLKPHEKALILLFLEGLKYKEIANIMGISETNVATKLSRIKRKLKEQASQLN